MITREHQTFLVRSLAGFGQRRRLLFAVGCACRVVDVLADYNRARKQNARDAIALVRAVLQGRELDNIQAQKLRDGLLDDGKFAVEELELPVTYTLRTILSALLVAMEDQPDHVEQAAHGALDTAASTDEAGQQATQEESQWQQLAIALLLQPEGQSVEKILALGNWPAAWLLRFEGNA